MHKTNFSHTRIPLLLLGLASFTVSTIAHAQLNLSREEVSATQQWLDARKARYTGDPILLHLRVGHERALLMPEPVRFSNADYQRPGYTADIDGDVVRFYPLSKFDREPLQLTGIDTGTRYVLRVRASAFGIRQPLQIFLAD